MDCSPVFLPFLNVELEKMVKVLSHNEWMQLTEGGITPIRSNELKAVDSSLKIYGKQPTPSNLELVHKSLVRWIGSKGLICIAAFAINVTLLILSTSR